jgi:DnaJ family protein C protein 19
MRSSLPRPQAALRPTAPQRLRATAPAPIATPILAGAALVGGGLLAMTLMKSGPKAAGSGKWAKGGFQGKMDKKEAAMILGLR